jgi:hypothetical protein
VELKALVLRVYILDVRVAAVGLGGVELGLRMCVLVGTRRGERGFERGGLQGSTTYCYWCLHYGDQRHRVGKYLDVSSAVFSFRPWKNKSSDRYKDDPSAGVPRLKYTFSSSPSSYNPIPILSYPILILLPKYIPSPARLPVSLGTDKPAQSPRSGQFGTVAPITHMCGWRGCQDWESPVVGLC